MTSTLIAKCVEAGAISWDDTVGAVLGVRIPTMRAEYRDVSFRHLCSHRSGLPANIDIAQLSAFPRESDDARADRIAYATLGLARGPTVRRKPTSPIRTPATSSLARCWKRSSTRRGSRSFSAACSIRCACAAPGRARRGRPGRYDQPVGHAPGFSNRRRSRRKRCVASLSAGYGPITDNPAALGPAGRVHANFEDVLKYLAAHRDRSSYPAARELGSVAHAAVRRAVRDGLGAARGCALA